MVAIYIHVEKNNNFETSSGDSNLLLDNSTKDSPMMFSFYKVEKHMKAETFLPIPDGLLKRQDITATTKLVMAYIQYRSNLEGWTFNPTNVAGELGISYRTAQRELKQLEADGIIKCIGYTKTLHHSYKKYAVVTKLNLSQVEPTSDKLTQVEPTSDKMGGNFGQNVMSNFGQNVLLQEVQEKEVVKEVPVLSNYTGSNDLNNQPKATSVSVGMISTSSVFGDFFKEFGSTPNTIPNTNTKDSILKGFKVFDKTGYTGLAIPSRILPTSVTKVASMDLAGEFERLCSALSVKPALTASEQN